MHLGDQFRQLTHSHAIVGDMSGDNVGGECKKIVGSFFGHFS
jgi:hypothetical protein